MTIVLGVDQASCTGLGVLEDGKLIAHDKCSFDGEWFEKVSAIKAYMAGMIEKYKPDIVGIENIQFQQNQDVYRKLAELKGVLENYLYENDIEYRIISPATWKSVCGIKKQGRDSEKKQAQDFVYRMFDVKVTQDPSDAICIAYTVYRKG
jgi:Holliday junction resolvasome RuvABC endonuclease subunit